MDILDWGASAARRLGTDTPVFPVSTLLPARTRGGLPFAPDHKLRP